jgi:hypothetical protein
LTQFPDFQSLKDVNPETEFLDNVKKADETYQQMLKDVDEIFNSPAVIDLLALSLQRFNDLHFGSKVIQPCFPSLRELIFRTKSSANGGLPGIEGQITSKKYQIVKMIFCLIVVLSGESFFFIYENFARYPAMILTRKQIKWDDVKHVPLFKFRLVFNVGSVVVFIHLFL